MRLLRLQDPHLRLAQADLLDDVIIVHYGKKLFAVCHVMHFPGKSAL
jgi:hypothetical protein